MENFEKLHGKGEFNVFNSMTAMTLETFLKVMEFDVDIQNKSEEERIELTKYLEEISTIIGLRMLKFWQHSDLIFRMSGNYAKEKAVRLKSADKLAPKIMENIRNKISCGDENSKSFLREFIDPKHNLPDEEIYEEMKALILASQDTTAVATSSTLLLLAMHKDVQEKVYEELIKVIGRPSDDLYIDYDQINQLEYLEMAINETMRLLPVGLYIFRTCSEEITSSEGYIIPAKTAIAIPIFNIHRNKKFWGEDALEFKPERFSRENISKIHPYAFLPFSKGQRMCLGWRYAMFLMKIQLAKILLNYKIDTKLKLNELTFKVVITMNIVQGHQINIERREI